MMNTRTIAMVSLVSTASMTTGCYSTWDLTPKGVVALDGFRTGQPIAISTTTNETIIFRDDSSLRFKAANGQETEAKFQSIAVEGSIFTGVEKEKGSRYVIDLSQMRSVQADVFSPGKTALATTGIVVLGVPTVAFAGLLIAIAASGGIGGGRPLRVAGRDEPLRASLHADPHARPRRPALRHAHEATRARVFAHWAKEASAEAASIPAFIALARDLQKASAPENLVRAVLRAAREEATHTELCTALANEHAELPIFASAPATPPPMDANLEALLQRIALEAFWDGCVAEGAAATVARRSLVETRNATTRLALETIARDEHEHAQLSRDIVAFCLSAGGSAVRRALGESLEDKRSAEEAALSALNITQEEGGKVDGDFLVHCGLPGDDLLHLARVENWERSVKLLTNA
ncbi:MAG TPA: ferritin-like domain-containing protein [Polyangium sp.]|nr:ferritin-like domain-containing protein [Polyangium sp.]